jgi:hypothetical protein
VPRRLGAAGQLWLGGRGDQAGWDGARDLARARRRRAPIWPRRGQSQGQLSAGHLGPSLPGFHSGRHRKVRLGSYGVVAPARPRPSTAGRRRARPGQARSRWWWRSGWRRRGRPTPPSGEDVARNLLRWYASSWSFLLGSKSPLGYLHRAPSSFELGENKVISSHILDPAVPAGSWPLAGIMPSALKIQETGKANDGIAGVIEARRLLGLERARTIRQLAEVERGCASLRRNGPEGRTAERGRVCTSRPPNWRNSAPTGSPSRPGLPARASARPLSARVASMIVP